MEAIEIIEDLRANNFVVKIDGEYLEVSPPEKVTDDLIQRLRKHKPAILKELQAEARRNKVLTMLADNPQTQRAFVTDATTDADNVIITMAIRGVASFEMLIPREKYDPFAVLELLNKREIQ